MFYQNPAANSFCNILVALLAMSVHAQNPPVVPPDPASPTVAQFNARGDGNANDLPAFEAAIRKLAPDKNRGGRLLIPPGTYRLSGPLHITRGMILEGSSGAGRNAGTVLKFDAGVEGIVVDRFSTSPDGGAGDWAVIRDLGVIAAAADGNVNGITLHARAKIENVYVRGFGGNGIEISAWARGNGPNTNANNWSIENVLCEGNGGHGLHVKGADANAGVAVAFSAMNNGGWGLLDESFLGNTYVGCHTENNKRGGYSTTNKNARSLFIGCYTESGQPPNQISAPSMVIGGLFGNSEGSSGYFAVDGRLSPNWSVRNQKDPSITTTLGLGGEVPRGALSFSASDGSLPYRLEYQKSQKGWWDLNYGEAGNGTVISFSTATSEAGYGQVRFPNGFLIGQGKNERKFTAAATPPTVGNDIPGEIVFNTDPDNLPYAGWIRSRSGNWQPFGPIIRAAFSPSNPRESSAPLRLASAAKDPIHALTFALDAAKGNLLHVQLTSDISSSDFVHAVPGQHIDILICQDSIGGHTFQWPTVVHGGMRVSLRPGACSAQSFVFAEGTAYATSTGAVDE